MEWNQAFVRAPEALALLPKAADGSIHWGSPGEPQAVKVALFDTGYRRHPALGFSPGANSTFLLSDEGQSCLKPRGPNAEDPLIKMKAMPLGHGTRTATCLAGRGAGFSGLCPGLPMVPFRVTNHSVIFADAATAIGKALDMVVERVAEGSISPIVNISLGRLFGHRSLGAAVDRAYEAGVIIICAAGQVVDRVTYPAQHARTIAVAGIERTSRG
ncbi:MAG: S8 family serine peptidase, partial [Pseudomonadota bacterium]